MDKDLADLIGEPDPERKEFHRQRSTGIGSSDAPVVLGLSGYKTPIQLWAEKTGRLQNNGPMPEYVFWGTALEPTIAKVYGVKTGRRIKPGGRFRRHPIHDFVIAHIDRGIVDDKLGEGVLEIKNVNQYLAKEWDLDSNEVPEKYRCQLMHEMLAANVQWGSLAALIGGSELRIFDMVRDQNYVDAMLDEEGAFWDYVKKDIPPPPIAIDNPIIGKIWKVTPGRIIELDENFQRIDEELASINGLLSDVKLKKDELEAQIKSKLQDAETGVLPNGVKFTFKEQTKKECLVAESTFRVLRRSGPAKSKPVKP